MWPCQLLTWSHSVTLDMDSCCDECDHVNINERLFFWSYYGFWNKKRLSYKQIKFYLKIFNLLITQPFLVRFENPLKLKLLVTPWSDLVWKNPQNREKVADFQNCQGCWHFGSVPLNRDFEGFFNPHFFFQNSFLYIKIRCSVLEVWVWYSKISELEPLALRNFERL